MRLIFCFISLWLGSSIAQNITLKGKIIDREDFLPIPSVYIGIDSIQNNQTVSDTKGEFYFQIDLQLGMKILFTHNVYDSYQTEIKKYHFNKILNDTLDLGNIELVFGDKMFETVEVLSEKQPEIVFGNQKVSVEDFELLDKKILMLVYEKTLKRSSEVILVDQNQNILSSVFVPGEAKELIHDFRGEVYLKTKEKIFHVQVNQNNRMVLNPLDRKKFQEQLEPIKDSLYEDLYFSNYSEAFPRFSYFEFDREDSVYTTVKGITDELMMEMYRAEFKYVDVRTKIWAHNLQNEIGIDKEEIVGASIFTKSVYYKPLYAPMFEKNDSIYIFDFYKNYMYCFVSDYGIVDSLEIYFHEKPKKSGWKKRMLQDLLNDEIYAVYDKFGYSYIKPINLLTGNTDGVFKLYYRYVEKIIVKDDYVYYTYRPFESVQKKYIYKEKIPNEVLLKKTRFEVLTKD